MSPFVECFQSGQKGIFFILKPDNGGPKGLIIMIKNKICFLVFLLAIVVLNFNEVMADDSASLDRLDAIIEKLEQKYARASFSVDFFQKSTIKALEISDDAHGKGYFKHPGMMRWEYEKPEKQSIISDGKTLWIYKPEDRQVMVGNSSTFFGGGKGGSFLVFIRRMKKDFKILYEKNQPEDFYLLKLEPLKKNEDVKSIRLSISKKTYDVHEISTRNSYDDETVIRMENIRFKKTFKDSMFVFDIPENVDVMKLD